MRFGRSSLMAGASTFEADVVGERVGLVDLRKPARMKVSQHGCVGDHLPFVMVGFADAVLGDGRCHDTSDDQAIRAEIVGMARKECL